MAAGGNTSILAGGDFWNGALSAGLAEGLGPTLDGPQVGTFEKAMRHAATGAAGAWLGGGDAGQGALTGLSGYLFNYLCHSQRDQRAVDLASCKGDQGCTQAKEAQWNATSTKQNLAMGQDLINAGVLPQDLADQLRSTDPSSSAYVSLLSRAAAYGPTPWLSYQLVNEMDGQPGISATRGGWDPQARANVEMSLLLPVAAPAGGALIGTGVAVSVPAATAWGVDAWAAYRAATASYSLSAAAGTGAMMSGATYTGTNVASAMLDSRHGADFTSSFDQRFSYLGLATAMGVGALGNVYQTQMYQWAGVPNAFGSQFTLQGSVIAANKQITSQLAGKAAQEAVKQTQQNPESKKANDQ